MGKVDGDAPLQGYAILEPGGELDQFEYIVLSDKAFKAVHHLPDRQLGEQADILQGDKIALHVQQFKDLEVDLLHYGAYGANSGPASVRGSGSARCNGPCLPHAAGEFKLTEREQEILALLVKGQTYKRIAADLGITFATVNKHVTNVYAKLRVHSVGEAVRKGLI